MARGQDQGSSRRRHQTGNKYPPAPKSYCEQRLEEARYYASRMKPNLKTPWHSFWSWAIIKDHIRLATVVLLMILISGLLIWDACFPDAAMTAADVAAFWRVVWGSVGITAALTLCTVIAWQRWERKIRAENAAAEAATPSSDQTSEATEG